MNRPQYISRGLAPDAKDTAAALYGEDKAERMFPEPHPFEADVTPEGVAFVFTPRGGYVPCRACDRDESDEVHRS